MNMQPPPTPEPEIRRRVEPIFDASGTLRHVPAEPRSGNEPTNRPGDRRSSHPARA
jgi:hypothetical protein